MTTTEQQALDLVKGDCRTIIKIGVPSSLAILAAKRLLVAIEALEQMQYASIVTIALQQIIAIK